MPEAAEPSADEDGRSGRKRSGQAAFAGRRRRELGETMSRKRQSRPRTKAAGPEAAEPSADEGGGSGRMEERASSVRRTEAASVGRNDEPEAAVVRRHGGAGWKMGGQWVRIAAWIAEATGARTAQEEPRHAFDANFPQVQPKRREQREQNRPSARLKGRKRHTSAPRRRFHWRMRRTAGVPNERVRRKGFRRRKRPRESPRPARRTAERPQPLRAAPRNRSPRNPASACNRFAP